jgi:hypothetical protein
MDVMTTVGRWGRTADMTPADGWHRLTLSRGCICVRRPSVLTTFPKHLCDEHRSANPSSYQFRIRINRSQCCTYNVERETRFVDDVKGWLSVTVGATQDSPSKPIDNGLEYHDKEPGDVFETCESGLEAQKGIRSQRASEDEQRETRKKSTQRKTRPLIVQETGCQVQ